MTATATIAPLELGVLFTQLGGGLALFLYGMRQMSEGLKKVAGGGMKTLLAMLTTNRFTAALAGAVVTAVIQSSSVTTVLIVGFISAGLMNLGQSIGVIMGANVGTTITTQIIAFQVYEWGLLMVAVGFFTEVFARNERIRQWGIAIMGLGLIFFGMQLMSIATLPLRQWPPFVDAMQSMALPALSVLAGAAFTAIVQSSSATTGIVIVLASQGLITLEAGIGLILGANIGTCVTAFLSAIGRPREALQAAWIHVIFNTLGALAWLFFIPQFADLVRTISPQSQDLVGLVSAAADTPRQIANAHTIFNVGNLLLFIWFAGPLGRLVAKLVPAPRPVAGVTARYLDEMFLDQPALALDQVRRELTRLARRVDDMIGRSLTAVTEGSDKQAAALRRADDAVDALYAAIIRYLARLSQKELVGAQPQHLQDFVGMANYLEIIGDIIEYDLLALVDKRQRNNLKVSAATRAELGALHQKVREAFRETLAAIESGSRQAALDAIDSKRPVNELVSEASAHIARRLVAEEPNRFENFQLESEIVEHYKRINNLTRRIAKLAVHSSTPNPDSAAE